MDSFVLPTPVVPTMQTRGCDGLGGVELMSRRQSKEDLTLANARRIQAYLI